MRKDCVDNVAICVSYFNKISISTLHLHTRCLQVYLQHT
jgi:hypothetical protein